MDIPNCEEFFKGYEAFEKHEKRDAMYKVATFLISHFWGNTTEIANGLGVLLLTWNQAFYRYGVFNFDELERCLDTNFKQIEEFRKRNIISLSSSDENNIRQLFDQFFEALKIDSGKLKGRKSPVAAAKALHLLAPEFFPLWDYKIAKHFGCYYNDDPSGQYVLFCRTIRTIANSLKNCGAPSSKKTRAKLIDKYNYSKYSPGWV